MEAFGELKSLSDTADGIIKANKQNKRLEEWFNLFKQAATSIVNDQTIPEDFTTSNDSADKHKLPDIVAYVNDVEKVVKKKQRISSALGHMKKDHILHANRNTPSKNVPCDTEKSLEPSTSHDVVFNETFVRSTASDNNMVTPDNDSRIEKSANSLNAGVENQEFYTPVGQNPKLSDLQTKTFEKTGRSSRKRKSSSPTLSNTISAKKVKVLNETVSIQKSIRKSLRGQTGKISETKFHKYQNRLPSAKISSSGANSSVLKENRALRVKAEAEESNQTLKKVLAARQIKAQEAKRKHEEKMQKTSQQRLKLEKEKDERLRTRKQKEVEKPLLRTVLDSKKKRTREIERNHSSEVQGELSSSKKTRANNSGTPKTPSRNETAKSIEKENKIIKTQDIKKNCNSEVKSDPPSPKEVKSSKSGTPIKTPRKKGTKTKIEENKNEKAQDNNRNHNSEVKNNTPSTTQIELNSVTPTKTSGKKSTQKKIEENNNEKGVMNQTYLAKATSPGVKEVHSKNSKKASPVNGEIFKTPVAPQRTISSTMNTTTAAKPNVERATPVALKQKQLSASTHQSLAISQSYEMTPARLSYVNYDISEIRSDDSDEDEGSKKNPKPIPGWASGVRLKNALVQQQYHNINTDEMFGNVFETPNLAEMMGVKNKRYYKRTSSAIWNSPSAFT